MLLNDIEKDIGRMCEAKGISKSQLASNMGITRQCLYRILISSEALTNRKIDILEELGYDVELIYKKK